MRLIDPDEIYFAACRIDPIQRQRWCQRLGCLGYHRGPAGFPDRNMQRGGRGVPFLTFILGYGLGMIVTLWIVIRNS